MEKLIPPDIILNCRRLKKATNDNAHWKDDEDDDEEEEEELSLEDLLKLHRFTVWALDKDRLPGGPVWDSPPTRPKTGRKRKAEAPLDTIDSASPLDTIDSASPRRRSIGSPPPRQSFASTSPNLA